MDILERAEPYDAIVVGSGPAGSIAARELTIAGANVLLLEGGRAIEPHELSGHKWPYQFAHRGAWDERQRPFYPDGIAEDVRLAGDAVAIDRVRALGGRSLHWNAVTLRFAEDDFREGAQHGLEPDWPISYQDIAPFYAEVERLIGVVGTCEGLSQLPDGDFYAPPPAFRCAEQLGRRACRTLGIPFVPVRKALLVGKPRGSRLPCHYCHHCMDGCEVGAVATSVNSILPDALATGRLTIRTDAVARQVDVDEDGRATGVSFIDRKTRTDHSVRGRHIILGCGAIETPRLLLNSKSPRFSNGLANSSGLVGRYLTGHMQASLHGYLEPLIGTEPTTEVGATDHSIIPRFNHLRGPKPYVGGFLAQVMYDSQDYPHHASRVAGFGLAWKRDVRALQPAMFQMGGLAKVVARRENCVSVDAGRTDRFGIPTPVVSFTYGENDRAIWSDMLSSLEEIFHAAHSRMFFADNRMNGFASHETGTCRMGASPAASVVDPFGRAHDVPNLLIVDGSVFPTFPEKNPTLTIMALSMRASRALARTRG